MRLNKQSRAQVVGFALAKLDTEMKALQHVTDTLSRRCYVLAVGKELDEAIAAVRREADKLPSSRFHHNGTWFRATDIVNYNVGGRTWGAKLSHDVPVPFNYYGSGPTLGKAITDEKLVADVNAHMEAEAAFKAKRDKVARSTTVLVDSVSSTEALAKIWPEGAAFFASPPLTRAATRPTLPATTLVELNELLGLNVARS